MALIICPECGEKVLATANPCPNCGYERPKTRTCPECGKELDDTLATCPECGFLFESEPKSNSQTVSSQNTENQSDNFENKKLKDKKTVFVYLQFIICGIGIILFFARGGFDLSFWWWIVCALLCYFKYYTIVLNNSKTHKIVVERLQRLSIVSALLLVIMLPFMHKSVSHDSYDSNSYFEESFDGDNQRLRELDNEVNEAKRAFMDELQLISVKATYPEYQGVYAQRLFFDANDALNNFKYKVEALQSELYSLGFPEVADSYEEDLRNIERNYEEVKRQVLGM